jgi:hypothetical protein
VVSLGPRCVAASHLRDMISCGWRVALPSVRARTVGRSWQPPSSLFATGNSKLRWTGV